VDYLFEDNDIKNELKNYHIRNSSYTQAIVLLLLLLLLVCVSFTIIGQPRNSVLIRRV